MILLSIVEDLRSGAFTRRVVIPRDGMVMGVSLRSPWMVAPGQTLDIGVTAQLLGDSTPRPLLDARPLKTRIKTEPEWWRLPHCLVPSSRTLAEVLVEAVQHGVDNPTHGANCSCMDSLVWELRRHIDRALPEVQRRIDNAGTPDEAVRYSPAEWKANMNARQRLHSLLTALTRSL
jgi:hypothetical protein